MTNQGTFEASIGRIGFEADYLQSSGNLSVGLYAPTNSGGFRFDQPVALEGRLRVSHSGPAPRVGQIFTVLQFPRYSGGFETVEFPNPTNAWQIGYRPREVTITRIR